MNDPVASNPEHYSVLFENDRVRVLEYRDEPGDLTTPHRHPDSVMITLSAFSRRLSAGGDKTGGESVDVDLPSGVARWLAAQEHRGENIGSSPTHTIFVELKEPPPRAEPGEVAPLGPSGDPAPKR